MRPKKRVLLFCVDEATASDMRLRLHIWGYLVAVCDSYEAAIRLAKEGCDSALLVAGVSDEATDLSWILKRVAPDMSTVELRAKISLAQSHATTVIYAGAGNVELRDVMRIHTTRRRGPKRSMQERAA